MNGNLTQDGANSYTWNARDQLTGITGPTTATFAYDGTGRRRQKVIGAATTTFLYDRLNPVQESTAGGAVNLLTGLGIDEYFTRTDTAATRHFLSDALSSKVALTDAAGAVPASYTYEPFGLTTITGTASGEFQYTGRENDGTSLYYYRAR